MSDMKKKAKTAPAAKPVMTQEENDLMMNRLMLGFVLAVCAVTAVMTLKNSYNTIQLYEIVGPIMSAVCILLAVPCIVLFGLRTKKRINDTKRILTRWNVLMTGAVSLFCGILFILNPSVACAYSIAMIIGACVLYFIWYIYPRAFFALACSVLAEGFFIHAGFALSTARAFTAALSMGARIAAVILPIAAIVFFLTSAKKHPKAFASIALWQIFCVLGIALIGAAVLWCGALGLFYFAYHYVLYALAASLIAVGIIYTVKSI